MGSRPVTQPINTRAPCSGALERMLHMWPGPCSSNKEASGVADGSVSLLRTMVNGDRATVATVSREAQHVEARAEAPAQHKLSGLLRRPVHCSSHSCRTASLVPQAHTWPLRNPSQLRHAQGPSGAVQLPRGSRWRSESTECQRPQAQLKG